MRLYLNDGLSPHRKTCAIISKLPFRYSALMAITALALLSGCSGGNGHSSSPSPVPSLSPSSPSPSPLASSSPAASPSPSPIPLTLIITPDTVQLAPGAQQPFLATAINNASTGVSWSVLEGASGGSVTSTGVYTASALAGTYHVVVKSTVNSAATATATVTVPLIVSVTPATVTTVTQPVKFSAAVNHAQKKTVTWSIQEGAVGGTITQEGVYNPPTIGGVFHIVAISTVDGTTQGVATITVESGGANGDIH